MRVLLPSVIARCSPWDPFYIGCGHVGYPTITRAINSILVAIWCTWGAFSPRFYLILEHQAHDKSPQAVSNLFHQPFFQERVTAIMAENRRDVMDLFRGERINSLETLVAIRDNEKAPAAARVACCQEILDRTLGRPVQRVEAVGEVTSSDPVAEVERLEAEVKRLKEEL